MAKAIVITVPAATVIPFLLIFIFMLLIFTINILNLIAVYEIGIIYKIYKSSYHT